MLGVGKEVVLVWFFWVRLMDYGSFVMFVWKCLFLCGDILGCVGLWIGMDDFC